MALKFLNKKDLFGDTPPLSTMLHQHLSRVSPGRSLKTIHASALTKESHPFCPREMALRSKLLIPPETQRLTTSEEVTFDIGRKLQDAITIWFDEMGAMKGDWECHGCGWTNQFCAKPKKCSQCGSRGFKPKEMRFKSAVSGASCGVDLLVTPAGNTKLVPVEIKTMDKDQFKKLAMPLAEHRVRTTLYLRIIAEDDGPYSKFIDTSQAIILYSTKGGYGCAQDWLINSPTVGDKFSPFKEFVVDRNDEMVEEYSTTSKAYYDYLEKGIMPCGICPSSMSKRATGCKVRTACWNGKHPPGETG